MKNKTFIISLLAILLVFSLTACTKTTTGTNTNKPSTTEALDSFWDSDGNGVADWQEEEVNLTYATWQYHDGETTIDTLLIQAFEAMYPNVHVTMQYVGESYEWDTNLQALAETGDLPDVMLVNRLETALPYNMLADITEYYNHDSDSEYIFDSLQNNGVYDGTRYAVPSFIYAKWWFVNLDILENAGIAVPDYDWTWDQMEAIAKACYNETTHTVGQSGIKEYWMELPKILKGSSSWAAFTYDGTKFNFDDPAFESAMEKLGSALQSNAVTNSYRADQIYEYYGQTIDEFFLNNGYNIGFDGHAAIWSSPSWTAKDYFDNMSFDWDVYPAPGGTISGNTDLIGVSSTCENIAAAYQLLKWMSYGEQGLETRFQFYNEYKDSLYISANNYPYPVADYGINSEGVNVIWNNLPYNDVPGMTSIEMLNALKNGAFNLNKETPGWDTVDSTVLSYLNQVFVDGTTTYAAVKDTIASESNRVFTEFNNTLKAQIEENKG